MALAKLLDSSKSTVIGFNGGGAVPLGQRKDTDKLAMIALESGDRSLLALFEHPMPSLDQLKKADVDQQLKQGPQEQKPVAGPDRGDSNTSNAKLDQ